MTGIMDFHESYMEWYRRITRRLITPPLHRDQMRYHNTTVTSQLLITSMVDIAHRSRGASSGELYDIHQLATSILRHIGEDHRISSHIEASTSYGSTMRSPMSPIAMRMQPIRGQGRGRGRAGGRVSQQTLRSLDETMLPPSTSSTPFPLEASTSPSSTISPPLSPTSPPPPLELIISNVVPPKASTPPSIVLPPLSPTFPPPPLEAIISDGVALLTTAPYVILPSPNRPLVPDSSTSHTTMIDMPAEFGASDITIPRRHRTPRRRQVYLPPVPSTPSAPAPSAPMETLYIAQAPPEHMVVYCRRPQKKRNAPSCGTH